MALQEWNATLTTGRDGVTGAVLTGVPCQLDPAKLVFSAMGPQRVQELYIDPGQDVQPGDYLTLTQTSGTVRTGAATFVDEVDDEDGELSYMAITVSGGLLTA